MDMAATLDEIAKIAEQNTKINENDYFGSDGLLVCGNCNTPKQVRVEFLGNEKTPYCQCKCESQKRKQADDIRRSEEQREIIQRNRSAAFPDSNDVKNWTFDRDDGKNKRLSNAAKMYVKNFESYRLQGKGLLLYGTVGTGKSFIAGCIANALLDKGYSVLMTSFAWIERTAFGKTDKQAFYDALNNHSLLIIDDFGVERNSEYMQEIVHSVIDGRTRANLPLILTSNLTSQELKTPQGIANQRIYSRILEMCHPIKVDGNDRRKSKSIENFAEMQKQLGL